MASATIEFANAAKFEYSVISPGLAIDGDDGTRAQIVDRSNDGSSLALWDPILPADFGGLDSLDVDLLWGFSGLPGRTIQYARVYSREATSGAWTLRFDGGGLLPPVSPEERLVSVPVTDLAALQLLIETYTSSGGSPTDPPDVEIP